MPRSVPRTPRFSLELLTAIALILLSFILRSPLTGVGPIVGDLRSGLGIGSVTIALMTSVPVLCFGVLTPLASLIIARTSVEKSIFITLIGALTGLILRSTGGIEISMCGTVLIGASLTVGNIVALMVIARDFPLHNQLMTGIYSANLSVGSMLTTALTAPVAMWLGWRIGLAFPVLFVLPALLVWMHVVRRRKTMPAQNTARATEATPGAPLWRRPLVWLLVAAFTMHLAVYYGLTAWLPDYYITDTGMGATAAGMIGALFQILALLGAFGAPLLVKKLPVPWILVLIAGCWIATPLGFWLAPRGFVLWSIIGGIASGGGFAVIFILIMQNARNLSENRRISAAVQGGAYTLSALGPILIGHLHQVSGNWNSGFLTMTSLACVMLLCALAVTRISRRKAAA